MGRRGGGRGRGRGSSRGGRSKSRGGDSGRGSRREEGPSGGGTYAGESGIGEVVAGGSGWWQEREEQAWTGPEHELGCGGSAYVEEEFIREAVKGAPKATARGSGGGKGGAAFGRALAHVTLPQHMLSSIAEMLMEEERMAHNNTVDDVAGTEELDRASGGQVLIEGMEEHVFLRLCGCGWARDVLEECWLSPSFLPRIPEAHRNTPQKLYARALEWLFLRAPVTKIPPRYADRERDEAVRRQKGVTNVVGFANLDTHKRMRALLHAWGSEAGMLPWVYGHCARGGWSVDEIHELEDARAVFELDPVPAELKEIEVRETARSTPYCRGALQVVRALLLHHEQSTVGAPTIETPSEEERESAAFERQEEIEALQAIFDPEDVDVLCDDVVRILLSEEDQLPAPVWSAAEHEPGPGNGWVLEVHVPRERCYPLHRPLAVIWSPRGWRHSHVAVRAAMKQLNKEVMEQALLGEGAVGIFALVDFAKEKIRAVIEGEGSSELKESDSCGEDDAPRVVLASELAAERRRKAEQEEEERRRVRSSQPAYVTRTLEQLENQATAEALEERRRMERIAYFKRLMEEDEKRAAEEQATAGEDRASEKSEASSADEEDVELEVSHDTESADQLSKLLSDRLACKQRREEGGPEADAMEVSTKTQLEVEQLRKESEEMLAQFRRLQKRDGYRRMQEQRRRLPSYSMRDEIVSLINENQVVVLSGETGCGKTTQVGQFVMDAMISELRGAECNILCTQPRRISAIGVAERVAQERDERCGGMVGYKIRLEQKCSRKTRMLFCTTGILLRRLQSDSLLEGVSHVIVDEVHERDLNTDFLLIILKHALRKRKTLKLVLMSATLNSEQFSAYFGGCPMIEIPGFTHPVREYFLEEIVRDTSYELAPNSEYARKMPRDRDREDEDRRFKSNKQARVHVRKVAREELNKELAGEGKGSAKDRASDNWLSQFTSTTLETVSLMDDTKIDMDLLEKLLEHICSTGVGMREGSDASAVLVFLPGMGDITTVWERLRSSSSFPASSYLVLPLHSTLPSADQKKVFDRPPPNVRKIVLSTNIAETSITIDDVVVVIDTGKHKETHYDPVNKMPSLREEWVSKANARQRRGRAGRVQPGVCYHMYTRARYIQMRKFQTPEILRVPLEELALQIKVLNYGSIKKFLNRALNPPTDVSIEHCVKNLHELFAIDDKERLTPLGYHLASLPVDVRIGKVMLLSAVMGCLDPILTIAATMSSRSPFVSPFGKRAAADKAKRSFLTGESDFLTVLTAYKAFREARAIGKQWEFCKKNFLSPNSFKMIEDLKKQFFDLLLDIGFVGRDDRNGEGQANANSDNINVIKGVLCAGLYPNVTKVESAKDGKGIPKFRTRSNEVALHPSSVNMETKVFSSRWAVFYEQVKSSKVYLRDITLVPPLALLMFGGRIRINHEVQVMSVDGWIAFRAEPKVAVLIGKLRQKLDEVLIRKIESPALVVSTHAVVSTISELFSIGQC